MNNRSAPPSKTALIEMIRKLAAEMGVERLSRRSFLAHSGVTERAINSHFDNWSDACRAAGIETAPNVSYLPKKSCTYTKEDCLAELRRVAALQTTTLLSSTHYRRYARISKTVMYRYFGSWHEALAAAGLDTAYTEQMVEQRKLLTREECIQHLQSVAHALGSRCLTRKEFNRNAQVSAIRVERVFGSWLAALQAADLDPSPNFKQEIPLSKLADDFLRAAIDLGRVPSLLQLTRRSSHAAATFSKKHGGYKEFKRTAIDLLFSNNIRIPSAIKELLDIERAQPLEEIAVALDATPASPHRQGRTLNFRAFVYAPTSEHDVVQIFGNVAEELGFEIVGNRSAFPDCEARRVQPSVRETFKPCLIEYEFASSDYRKHKHPLSGCDLVVCWEHDWHDCPIEVLELKSEIKKLQGWK